MHTGQCKLLRVGSLFISTAEAANFFVKYARAALFAVASASSSLPPSAVRRASRMALCLVSSETPILRIELVGIELIGTTQGGTRRRHEDSGERDVCNRI